MSQYPHPSPYQPPSYNPNYYYGGDPYAELLRPARVASVIMFVLGGLAMLFGTCLFTIKSFFQNPQFVQQFHQQFPNRPLPPLEAILAMAAMLLGIGLLMIVLGAWVRRGSRAAAIVAMVVTSLELAFWGVAALYALLAASPMDLCANVVVIIPLAVLVLRLSQAVRASAQLEQAAAQYQAQYWQYIQQQQQYMQPPPPAPPAPPQQPPTPPQGQS